MDLRDLLSYNLKANTDFPGWQIGRHSLKKTFTGNHQHSHLGGGLSNYSLVLWSSHPSMWPDLLQYLKLLIIQTAKKCPGQAWQSYDVSFRKDAAASALRDWSRMNADLYNFHTGVPSSPSALSQLNSGAKVDNNPKSSQVCYQPPFSDAVINNILLLLLRYIYITN